MEKVQFSLRMSDEELRIFKLMAANENKSISDFIVDLVHSGLFNDDILMKQFEQFKTIVRGDQ